MGVYIWVCICGCRYYGCVYMGVSIYIYIYIYRCAYMDVGR